VTSRATGWRRVDRLDRQIGRLWALVAGALLLLLPAAGAVRLPACPFRLVTGTACPSCGSTRAVVSLAEGRWLDALALNPGFTVALILFVGGGLVAPLWNRWVGRLPRRIELSGWAARGAAIALVGINWVWVVVSGV
jgi:hypothetical protein